LFDTQYFNLAHASGLPYHAYAVSPDGERFLIPRLPSESADTTATSIAVALNWSKK